MTTSTPLSRLVLVVAAIAAGCVGGCAPRPRASHTACSWVIGRAIPRFDPTGPPETARWALERLLSHGLLATDSTGGVVAAAARLDTTRGPLVLTFHLRSGLTFVDGAPCRSDAFRHALEQGIGRTDHATVAWLLGALRGMDVVRVGRPLPDLGIDTPDDSTLVLRLSRPDPDLPRKLALPGVGVPWRPIPPDSGWGHAVGLGPYKVATVGPRLLTLVRVGDAPGADTVHVRFAIGASRTRWLMRNTAPDLVWPMPPALVEAGLPEGYRIVTRAAVPSRRLLLVMRADLPPTTKLPARHALAHGLNHDQLLRALGSTGSEVRTWLPEGGPFDAPTLDAREVAGWMDRGDLGRSFHVVMTYDADGAGAEVARTMQDGWAAFGLYADLVPLRGALLMRALENGTSHLALVEAQPLFEGVAAELAPLVMPLRGPAVGSFRTGWRTRDFDAWLAPRANGSAGDPGSAQRRLEQERVVIPIAELPWRWAERDGAASRFDPRFGPECAAGRSLESPIGR